MLGLSCSPDFRLKGTGFTAAEKLACSSFGGSVGLPAPRLTPPSSVGFSPGLSLCFCGGSDSFRKLLSPPGIPEHLNRDSLCHPGSLSNRLPDPSCEITASNAVCCVIVRDNFVATSATSACIRFVCAAISCVLAAVTASDAAES